MRKILYAALLLLALPLSLLAQADRREVREGNRKFRKGAFQEAEIDYRKAVLKDTASVAGQYDLASALYRQEDYASAAKALGAVRENAPASPHAADYFFNAGDVALQQKDYKAAFFDTGLWMMMLLGFAVLGVGMATSQIILYIGAGIAIACAVGLVLTQGRDKKGFGKVIGGLASLYDVTSYISDLLSYSRLLALGLTTGVMAQVFNMLSTMFGRSVVGFIFMVLIMVVGHAINIGLNALGSYVHTMRLQYVEMFSKFYEGGGKEFEPFSLKSKYIKIQEDK